MLIVLLLAKYIFKSFISNMFTYLIIKTLFYYLLTIFINLLILLIIKILTL